MPIRRAIQRDEPAIKKWRVRSGPNCESSAARDRVLVFEDESGFYLLPGLVRTYAPEGRTPIIHESRRARLVGDGWNDSRGQGLYLGAARFLNGLHVIEFLTTCWMWRVSDC